VLGAAVAQMVHAGVLDDLTHRVTHRRYDALARQGYLDWDLGRDTAAPTTGRQAMKRTQRAIRIELSLRLLPRVPRTRFRLAFDQVVELARRRGGVVLTVHGRDRAVVVTPEPNEELVWRRRALEEILATAATTMGSHEAAQLWLGETALALNKRRPLDLLNTPAGVELLKRVLGRMEYGVYT
jgi:hypothetical protein